VATGPLLEIYGIEPIDEGVFMARWFGVALLANGRTTLLARNAAESEAGRAIAAALVVSYSVGVLLALWGTLTGEFNALGWIAVGLNLLLALGFWSFRFRSPKPT
jgi:LPXTG-motif cell wall-anchored protein